jgi:hypothetical protein
MLMLTYRSPQPPGNLQSIVDCQPLADHGSEQSSNIPSGRAAGMVAGSFQHASTGGREGTCRWLHLLGRFVHTAFPQQPH